MRIPFTKYMIVEETDDEIMGREELIKALRIARKGGNSYDRRKALRNAMRAAYKLKVVRKCKELQLWRKLRQIGKQNPMPTQ